MRNTFTKIGLTLLAVIGLGVNAFSQCTSAPFGQYPAATFNPGACSGFNQTITTCAFTGEYSLVNLTAGTTYTFSTSVASDYITITDAAITPLVFGTGSVIFNCVSTGTYRFYRHDSPACGSTGSCRNAYVLCGTPPPPPTNDECINAIPLCGGTVTGSTTAATPNGTYPVCGFANNSNSVWYSMVGNGGSMTISLCGSSYDTYLSVFTGTCGALTCVGSSDDFCGASSEVTLATTTAGTIYYIEVKGYNTASGTYTLTTPVTTPVNDACTAAISIPTGTVSGTTTCSTVDAVPAAGTASAPTAGGVWYAYTTSCSGNITASVCSGTTYDSQISIFSGTCAAPVAVDGNNDFCGTQSSVTWAGAAGTTYYILVHGNGTATGSFSLNLAQVDVIAPTPDVATLPTITSPCGVTLTAPTATDNCAGAITGTTPQTTYTLNGTYNVVWSYNDGNGNTSTQSQSVTINDVTAPVSQLPGDTTIAVDPGTCCATYSFSNASATPPNQVGNFFEDGWTNNGVYSTADDIVVPAGVTWSVTNATFDAFTILPLPSTIDVVFYDDAGGFPGTVIATDVINSGSYTATVVGNNFGIDVYHYDFPLTTPVVLTGGGSGATYWIAFQNNGTSASYWEVSSLGAYGNNALQVAGNLGSANWAGPYVNTGADHVYSLTVAPDPLFIDGCGGPVTEAQTAGPASGTCFPLGTTTITHTGTDENGNTNTYSFNVTVIDDQAPIPNLDSNAVYNFSSTDLPMAIVDAGIIMDSILVSGVPTPLAAGDLSSVCLDIQHTFDSDLTISLVSPTGTILILSDANGGAEDDYIGTCFDMSASSSINSASAPFVGSYTPEGAGGFDVFNGEDPNGYWYLVVQDNFTPDVGALTSFSINFDFHWEDMLPSVHSACATLTAPTASDNCGSTITATTTDPTSYTADGTYNVTWTYTDAAGNTTTQTQEVVVDDVTGPVPTQSSIPPSSGSCSASAESIPTAVDGCTGATINGTTTDATTYNVAGTYTITWSYDDGNGNITTQTQTIIVTDTQDPVPSQPILPNVVGNCTVTVSTIPTATDNCSVGTINGTTTDPLTYNVVGTFFIIWTYTDVNGNTHTQNQTVVVNPCLGIEGESGEWNALVYPNPGSGIFTLSLSEMPTENTEIKLVDGLGQVLYSGVLQNQTQQFDFSHLASATYYLLITNNNGHISKPVIIRHDY